MPEEQHHHHHHHHHHKMDGASKFKRKNLMALERQKKFAKYGLIVGYVIAALMGIAVIVAYTFL